MKKRQQNSGKSRRRFLNLSVLFGAGMLFSGKAQAKPRQLKSEDKVRLISPDGQVLEVDKSHIPNFGKARPISDIELQDWKKSKK